MTGTSSHSAINASFDPSQQDLFKTIFQFKWNLPKPPKPPLLRNPLVAAAEPPRFELDVFAILLNAMGKVERPGHRLKGSDVVFYNNPQIHKGHVHLSPAHKSPEQLHDFAQLTLNLKSMPQRIQKVIVGAIITDGKARMQDLHQLEEVKLQVFDDHQDEIVQHQFSYDANDTSLCSTVWLTLERSEQTWAMNVVDQRLQSDQFGTLLAPYF